MSQSAFGLGLCAAVPIIASGVATPRIFAALQDLSSDYKYDEKPLYGQTPFPIELARGKGSITIKASAGRVDADFFNMLFFSQNVAAGEILSSGGVGERSVIPATPYTVTVANSATVRTDLGVFDVASGLMMTKVAASPATGQYSYAAGVYTFAAADTLKTVLIYYTYGSTTTGRTITLYNNIMDTAPRFSLTLSQKFNGKTITQVFNSVSAHSMSMPFKQDDYMLPSFEMSAQDDGTGILGYMSITG